MGFLPLKHQDKDTPADLMLKVSKLVNNVGSTVTLFPIQAQATYTNEEVKKLVIDSNKRLKSILWKLF